MAKGSPDSVPAARSQSLEQDIRPSEQETKIMKGLGFYAYVHHDVVCKINRQDLARRMAMAGTTDAGGAAAICRQSRRTRLNNRLRGGIAAVLRLGGRRTMTGLP
jgi:hypothetical protein